MKRRMDKERQWAQSPGDNSSESGMQKTEEHEQFKPSFSTPAEGLILPLVSV